MHKTRGDCTSKRICISCILLRKNHCWAKSCTCSKKWWFPWDINKVRKSKENQYHSKFYDLFRVVSPFYFWIEEPFQLQIAHQVAFHFYSICGGKMLHEVDEGKVWPCSNSEKMHHILFECTLGAAEPRVNKHFYCHHKASVLFAYIPYISLKTFIRLSCNSILNEGYQKVNQLS